jgi:hypothetical protein
MKTVIGFLGVAVMIKSFRPERPGQCLALGWTL